LISFARHGFDFPRLLESVLETTNSSLSNGEDVLITRRGRNPATGEDLTLDPRRVITFKCSPRIGERINGGD
jgi:integration host factor subunit alpha